MFVSYICIEKCDADAANTKNQIREYEESFYLSTLHAKVEIKGKGYIGMVQ
jgi:hypothetical protein